MKFSDRVYEIVKKIPKGKVTTYKDIAEFLGNKAYRAVGQALKRNPRPMEIPCHRVVRSDGKIGGYFGKSDKNSVNKKIALLRSENVEISNNKIVNFNKFRTAFRRG